MYQWCEFKSRRGKNNNLTAFKSNSNIVWFNFQTYIHIYIESMLMAKWTWTSKNILLTWKRFKVSLYVINSQTSFKCCNASSFIFYHWPQHDTIVCVRTIKNGRAYDIKWIVCCSVDKNLTLPWAGQLFEWTIAQQQILGRQWFH